MQRKPRNLVIFGVVALLFGVFSSVAYASGLHYKIAPTFTLSNNDSTVTATGEVAGAGTFITTDISATFTFAVTCTNPAGGANGGSVPGQNGSGSADSGPSAPIATDHGNAFFSASVTATPSTGGSCPNSSWTINRGPADITSATLTITSSNGGTLTTTDNSLS